MAITENRLNIDSVVKINKVDFESKKDFIANKSSSEQLGPTNEAAKKLVNNEVPKHGIVDSEANAVYGSDNSVPEVIKIDKSKTNLSPVVDKKNSANSLTDVLLSDNKEPFFKLSPQSNIKLDKKIDIKLKDIKKRYPNLDTSKMAKDVKANVINSLSMSSGTAIKSKKNIVSSLEECIGLDIGDIGFDLDFFIDASILDVLSCAGIKNFIDGISSISSGISAMVSSLIDTSSINKLDTLLTTKILKDTVSTDPTNTALVNIKTKGTINKVLDNLSKDNIKTNSTNCAQDDLIDSLNSYDPNWNKDDIGQVNYFRTKDNDLLIANSVKYNVNKVTIPTTPTNVVTSDFDASKTIAIINA